MRVVRFHAKVLALNMESRCYGDVLFIILFLRPSCFFHVCSACACVRASQVGTTEWSFVRSFVAKFVRGLAKLQWFFSRTFHIYNPTLNNNAVSLVFTVF
jgi:hypothetical protein